MKSLYILSLLLLSASLHPSVIVQWKVQPGLRSDWSPVAHWRYGDSQADRRSWDDDFGHAVKESFLYSHHV